MNLSRSSRLTAVAIGLAMTTTGCRVVADIFKAGVGVGVLVVIVAIGLVAGIASLLRRRA